MKNRKKLLSMILAVLIIVGAAGTAWGAGNYITKKIWQGPITMYKNNQQVQLGVNPLIMDGTTYVPVRAMAQLLGMNVTWDNASRSIFITDNSQSNMAYYAQLLAANEAKEKEYKKQIEQLESDKKELQNKLDEANKKLDKRGSSSSSDLRDVEDDLNRYCSKARIDGRDLRFDFTVREGRYRSGSRYDITITVTVRDNDGSRLNTSAFIDFLEDDVLKEFKRSYRSNFDYDDITFEVEDYKDRRNNCTFNVTSSGRVIEK